MTATAHREVVRLMKQRGMSDQHALRVVGMSASALRDTPRPDGNVELRRQIVDMAQRYRRYGAPTSAQEKIPPADRQLLIRPGAANEVWSMDFVFDRIAAGRALDRLGIVDDATHEAVAVMPEHAIGGDRTFVTRSLVVGGA